MYTYCTWETKNSITVVITNGKLTWWHVDEDFIARMSYMMSQLICNEFRQSLLEGQDKKYKLL